MTKLTYQSAPRADMDPLFPIEADQPGWLVRLWRRMMAPDRVTVRYFVSYDYYWKDGEYLNGAKRLAMGHCILDVQDGIDSWEKVCLVQNWIIKNVTDNTQCKIVTELRINNFIPIKKTISE